MADTIDPQRRSENMRRIRSVDTKPELLVRRITYGLGFRYRLHQRELPGCPDLVFGNRKKVIFVHGCFWHQHKECPGGRKPRSKSEYWNKKLNRNVRRDNASLKQLREMGWDAMVIWECELAAPNGEKRCAASIRRFLAR